MNINSNKNKVIELIENAINYAYPVRWVDEKTSLGDFDGMEYAIDVFRIPSSEQLLFLSSIERVKGQIREILGENCLFIFHTPSATRKYYSHLCTVTEGVHLENNGTIKIPLPVEGGIKGSPEIIGPNINFKLGVAA